MSAGPGRSYDLYSWSQFYGHRLEVRRRFPDFWKIRIRKSLHSVVLDEASDNCTVLDVGAFDRSFEKRLQERYSGVVYKSMDIDREGFHEYYSFDDIHETFDLIFLFEVIEHVEFEEGIALVRRCKNLLKPGGRLILTTPNMYHPNRYWEYDHKVPYRYDAVGGLLLAEGMIVCDIYRIYNDAIHRRLFRLLVTAPLHRHLQIDFAKSITVVAQNPS